MDTIGICPNGTANMESPHSAVPPTETPPPGYMSEDGDPIDPNDNMSKYYSLFYNIFLQTQYLQLISPQKFDKENI